MRFNYQAVNSAGFTQDGEIEASSREDALEQLSARELTPVRVKEKSSSVVSTRNTGDKIRQADLVALVRELATLLSSGVGMTEALATLLEATQHTGLNLALRKLSESIHAGQPFSESLKNSGLNLPDFVYALARAGEATGDIGAALVSCADQLEFEDRMRAEAREALTYPIILILTGIGAIGFIFSFVVPRFAGLLSGRKVDLPWLSQAVLSTGMFVNTHWQAVLLTLGLLAIAGYSALELASVRRAVAQVASRLPGISLWMLGAETARWTATLSVLVRSRVPILLALDLASTSVRLPVNRDRLSKVQDDVRLGKKFSSAIEERQLLEGSALSMLKVGEKTGELAAMLGHVALHASARHRALQRQVVSLIEPASILVIGLTIGVIMVGVVLAMTSLTEIKL
ncbi:MAG: type II secretion system F family protein [Ramlibacter sp.]